ncbi:hypothetical protein ACFPN7_26220 [Amycolatopsis halotolerans]
MPNRELPSESASRGPVPNGRSRRRPAQNGIVSVAGRGGSR